MHGDIMMYVPNLNCRNIRGWIFVYVYGRTLYRYMLALRVVSAVIMTNEMSNHGPNFPTEAPFSTVSWSNEGTIMTSLNPLLQENLLYQQYCYHTRRLDGDVARHITKTH